ncbi:hypothetical protein GC167_04685 [bacterium]|nr:hypothetical protein [bacterium]
MKGIVFTEFFEMVERRSGYKTVDQLIQEVPHSHNGVYTAIGNYPHEELVAFVIHYCRLTSTPIEQVLREFGHHMLGVFSSAYPQFFDRCPDVLSFLESVDSYIHLEVLKLYPDAQLPRFDTRRIGLESIEMTHRSDRGMSALAYGLIEQAMHHYGQIGQIETTDHPEHTVFRISLNA